MTRTAQAPRDLSVDRKRRRALAIALGSVALPVLTAAQPAPAGRELRLSVAVGPAYPQGNAAELWARLIGERSGGRIAVKLYPGATLVNRDPARECLALRDGSIDMAVGSTLYWSVQLKELHLFALPWLLPSQRALDALTGGEIGARLFERIEVAGIVPLAWAANGFFELATKQPIHGPKDLSGLRIRVPRSPLLDDTLIALGALPVAMSFAHVQASIESGALDGEGTTVAAFAASRAYALGLKHLTLWDAHADALVFGVNRAVWERWGGADRGLVREAAREAAGQANVLVAKLAEPATLAEIAAQGAIVQPLSAAGKDAFRGAARAVYDRWAEIVGADLALAAETAIANLPAAAR